MAMSKSAQAAYKKAVKAKKKKKRGQWLLIQKGDSFKEIVSKIITQIACVVLAGCILILGNEARLMLANFQLNSSLQTIVKDFSTAVSDAVGGGDTLTPAAEKLLQLNPDTVGWVVIDGTNVNLPVVQRKSADGNEYYLTRSFDGSSNKAGTIFLDYRATLNAKERSENLVLYGHNQRDKSMFGDLAQYKHNLEFYKAHPTVTFASNYRTDVYKIFAMFVTPVEPYQTSDGFIFDYHNYINFDKNSDYDTFYNLAMERTQIITGVDIKYGDEFLTLSTCSNEFEPSRFVVIARKVRKGEDTAVDTSAAYVNPNAKEPEWDVIYGR